MHIALPPDEREEVLAALEAMAQPSRVFLLLIVLSTGIAAFGLLANSTAVVIGAMLVAPLMGPIFSIALGLVRGDQRLVLRAGATEVLGVSVALGMAVIIGLAPLRPEFGTEILARTQPTLYDILIALLSGLAGAYSLVNKKVSNAIAGVAIATALVPPLASCGLLLAAGEKRGALGALLLFLANFVAIQFAAAVIFLLAGLGEARSHRPGWAGLLRVMLPGLAALAVLGVLMTRSLISAVQDQRLRSLASSSLQALLDDTAGARLDSMDFLRGGNGLRVVAIVLTPREFTAQRVDEMEQQLKADLGQPVELVVRSLLSRDVSRGGPVFVDERELEGQRERAERAQRLKRATEAIEEALLAILGARLVDLTVTDLDFVATVEAPDALGPEQVGLLQEALRRRLDEPIRLTIRSVLATVATDSGYIFPTPQSAAPYPLAPEESSSDD